MLCKEITKEALEGWRLVLGEPLPFLLFGTVQGSVCTSGLREGSDMRHQAPVGSSESGVDLGDLWYQRERELPNISPALW